VNRGNQEKRFSHGTSRRFPLLKLLGQPKGTKRTRFHRFPRPNRKGHCSRPRNHLRFPQLPRHKLRKESAMSVLARLAGTLGLSSQPRPAPPTLPIQPTANDKPIPSVQPDRGSARHFVTAATASHEWRQPREQYINHLMACRACYAPSGRHCTAGSALSQQYSSTPMAETLGFTC
jgi:hypothetical protein